MIRLYWWTGDRGSNFGDALSPWLVSRVFGVRVKYSDPRHADLAAVGSLLGLLPRDFAGIVWGSGTMHSTLPLFDSADIRLVRGPVSNALLDRRAPFGDPALLTPRYFSPPGKRYRLGVMAHHGKMSRVTASQIVDRLPQGSAVFIDPLAPVDAVLCLIGQCEAIVSESLHGLIVADSYGIPNARGQFAGSRSTGDLKYLDYWSSVGRDPAYVRIVPATAELEDIISSIARFPQVDRHFIKKRQKAILQTV